MSDQTISLAGLECANHRGVAAEGLCQVCGKPLCAQCRVQAGHSDVCEDPEHKAILGEWSVLFRSQSDFEADMIVKNLEYQGFSTKCFSSRAFKEIIGEDPRDVSRVFVPRGEEQGARAILVSLGLLGN